jgi:hypothetical protein
VCESLVAGMYMADVVVVNTSRVVAEVAQLDLSEAEVGTAYHRGPDQLPNSLTIRETHGAIKVLAFSVRRRNWGGIEAPKCRSASDVPFMGTGRSTRARAESPIPVIAARIVSM